MEPMSNAPDTGDVMPEDSLDIEIIDDTPAEDRNRAPLPKQIVEELENEDLEEYSEKVKKRLSQMKKVWHDERREKEREAREKAEAIRFAQQTFEENKKLKERLGKGEQVLFTEVTKSASKEIESAKEKLKAAYESGDASQITDAQELLTDAKLKLKDYERLKPTLQAPQTQVKVQQPAPAPAPVIDHKAEAWRQNNQWFGVDEEMTALALGLHEKLVRSGVDPRSDDYYDRVNRTMRQRFPEKFSDDQSASEERPAPRKTANVVAPVTRSTSPRQVRLTPSQVALAKKLGLSNEAYAKEMMKLENSNG